MSKLFLLLFLLASTSLAQVKVVQLDSYAGKPIGSSLGVVINNKTPGNLTAFSSNSIYNSIDSGKTWTATRILAIEGAEQLQVVADAKGELYSFYTKTGNDEKIFISKSSDNGKKWTDLTPVNSGKGKDTFISLSTHPKRDNLMMIWTQLEDIQGLGCVSNVYTAISASGGKKWGQPILINSVSGDCSGGGKMLRASAPLLGRDGKTFIMWAGGEKVFLDRSYDGGELWVRTDLPIADQPGGWNLVVPDAGGVTSVPAVAVDNTEFRTTGTLYIAYADQKNGATDTDIWMMRSPNHGDNWTYPLRVNLDEPGSYQYSPHIAVDQTTGFVYTVFFDRRNYEDGQSDIYLASSGDAGGKFRETKINDTPITKSEVPPVLTVAANKGIVMVLWSTTEAGQTTVRAVVKRQIDLQ